MSNSNLALSKKFNKKPVRIISYLLLGLAIFVVVLPLLLEVALEKILVKQGAESASVQNIDLNLFTGYLSIEQLQIKHANQPRLQLQTFSVDFDWSALWRKRIKITELVIENSKLDIVLDKDESLQIAGFTIPLKSGAQSKQKSSKSFDWGMGIEQLRLVNNQVNLSVPKLDKTIQLKEITLQEVLTWQVDQKSNLSFKVEVDSAQIEGQFSVLPFAEKQILEGKINLSSWSLEAYQQMLVAFLPPSIKSLDVVIGGQFEIAVSHLDGDVQLQQSGNLGLQNFDLNYQNLNLASRQLNWDGRLRISQHLKKQSVPSVSLSGQFNAKEFIAEDAKQNLKLLGFNSLQTNVDLKPTKQIKLENIELTNLVVSEKKDSNKSLVNLGNLSLTSLRLPSEHRVELGKLKLKNLVMNLVLNEEKEVVQLKQLLTALPKPDKQTENEPTNKSKAKSNFSFSLESLALLEKNQIHVETFATQPVMNKRLMVNRLTLSELDSSKVEQDTQLALDVKVDKYTDLKVKGAIQPFNPKVNSNLDIAVKELDLYAFSPLIRRDLGYQIQSGSLNADAKIVIKNNKLDAKNKLKLVGFEMASVEKLDKQGKNNSKDEYQKSKSQGFNSMGLALNMLRDKDNNIDLDVPVKGDLSSPDFEAKSVINTALMSALKGSTKVALALSLQPYGAIYLASKYAIDKASEVSLQPVEFLPGKTTVKPDMSAYLTKIAELMKSKKKLHIKICGFYNLQDKKAMVGLKLSEDKLKNKLYQLAEQRQEKVKNWLVTKGGVATKNLVTCHPEFQDQKPSGVNLLM